MRNGATKISDHWVRSPLLNVNRACQNCHHVSEKELLARVDGIQDKNYKLLQRVGAALMDQIDAILKAKKDGATEEQLKASLELQRKAQWRIDFIAAENSMGFHAPQEAARILGDAIDYARQGEVAALKWVTFPPYVFPAAEGTPSMDSDLADDQKTPIDSTPQEGASHTPSADSPSANPAATPVTSDSNDA